MEMRQARTFTRRALGALIWAGAAAGIATHF
jgi:hypothetical protein